MPEMAVEPPPMAGTRSPAETGLKDNQVQARPHETTTTSCATTPTLAGKPGQQYPSALDLLQF